MKRSTQVHFDHEGEIAWSSLEASYRLETRRGVAAVISDLEPALEEARRRVRVLSPALHDLGPGADIVERIHEVAAAHPTPGRPPVIWIEVRERASETLPETLRALNRAREELGAAGPVFIILAGGSDFLERLAGAAPDLWSVARPVVRLQVARKTLAEESGASGTVSPDARPVRWLHLSDLHLGSPGRTLWWQMEADFRNSLQEHAARCMPHLVLITGDLTNKGTKKEYELADLFLEDLRRWLREAGCLNDPLVLPVPGNHDLARPAGEAAYPYMILDQYGNDEDPRIQDFKQRLWEGRSTPDLIEKPFREYRKWLERTIKPQFEGSPHRARFSRFPGDFCVEVNLEDRVPMVVVGLNSAWMQYAGGPFKGKLEVPPEQFQLALSGDENQSPLRIFDSGRPGLLLMHHPPAWLSEASLRSFKESVYTPERFHLCLFGHMHAGRSENVSISGGKPRYYYQSPSLFGLEKYGTGVERRSIGYSFGRLSADGEIRVLPLVRITRGSGVGAFVPDPAFEGAGEDGFELRPPAGRPQGRRTPAVARKVDWSPYLQAVVEDTDHINIKGIGSGAGPVKTASRYAIERLFVPLRSHAVRMVRTGDGSPAGVEIAEGILVREEKASHSPGLEEWGESRVSLSELLPVHDRLFIEGQPGAGKTTFLKFVACMLARDCLGVHCPEGNTWRRRYLGMDKETVPIPVLLGMAGLQDMLKKKPGGTGKDDRNRLLDLLDEYAAEKKIILPRKDVLGLLNSGRALLLLDGLDEVSSHEMRERVFTIFRDACKKWKKIRIVVTSRPIQQDALQRMGFGHATIDSFGPHEIRSFIQHWVAGLYQADPDQALPPSADSYHRALLDAILERAEIRLLASNPVMLTCLSVVHWNDGRLPAGRSRVYRAVLDWLIKARAGQRREEEITDRFALRGFACIALGMMNTEDGKQAMIGLDRAAELVEPMVKRDFPDLETREERLTLGLRWLRLECLASGIVEEVRGDRIRFWHLTFQEYLAALQLAWLGDIKKGEGHWWPVIQDKLEETQWRETVDLFPGCLLDEGGEGRVDLLLKRVMERRESDLASEARTVGILGRLLQPLKVYEYNPDPSIESGYQEARERSLEIFTLSGAEKVPIKKRIEAAEALGQGGDPRLAPEALEFLEIPGMRGVKLGKFPVTVEEYQRFVEGRGYEEQDFWDEVGWRYRKKRKWEAPDGWDVQLRTPNRPVVRVSWYEACAYCRWRSRMGDREVRLPTVAEWKGAATPRKGEYPWGEEKPDPELANFANNVGRPTPVGVYPGGAGPAGHLDLAGNVWEWCADEEDWEDEEEPEETGRALRGGSFWGDAVYLRVSARRGNPARYRNVGIGFRVAVAPASP